MAIQQWKTVSVKVNDESRNAIELICKREGDIAINKFLADLVAREIEPVINPKVLAENKGMPQVGGNKLNYLPEKDNFLWQIDLGVNGMTLLSEDVSPTYLEDLKKAIDEALAKRAIFQKENKGAVIPQKLLKYGVKKNVSTRT